jgi:GNAT superfamily N-acetyltransferase
VSAGPRKATERDAPGMVEMLSRAFYDDPVFKWLFPDDDKRLTQSKRYFEGRARILLRQGDSYTVDGAAAAAMWAAPGEWHDPPIDVLRQFVHLVPALGRRIPRSLAGLRVIEERHPTAPHWYLSVLGTDPERQGQGLGSAVMAPVLEECDRLEIPAYLETGTERNVAFYTRHGFRVTEEIQLPDGPKMWLMWRDPKG